jgi:hypothetical protein
MQLITDFPKNIRFGFALESETRCSSWHAQPGTLANELISSSVMPSLRYSSDLSALMLTNGSTATDLA